METSKSDLRFPFGMTSAGTNQEQGCVNAADSHLIEIQDILGAKQYLDADVLAVIRFEDEFEPGRSCVGQQWRTMSIRMRREKLLSLDSKKIHDMFEPSRQQRIRRRLGFAVLPPGVEYVLDFTPPGEGPELADLTAALWLPRVVKLWFLAGQYLPEVLLNTDQRGFPCRPFGDKAVGAMMALGHDDVCKCEACLDDITLWEVNPTVPGIYEEDPYGPGPKYIPAWRKIEDYCRTRHRVAIMRVLRAINGENLLLNSAARMWTVAQVAIHLEIPRVVVDPVTQWLVAPPNTKFIEICPERAFQLAFALQIPSVLIASFKLLVSELAVDFASDERSPWRPPLTWVERRRDDYGDFPSDPVEYAARAFVDRITSLLATLLSDDALDNLGTPITEWEKLRNLEPIITYLDGSSIVHSQLKLTYTKLVNALKAVFRRGVTDALMAPMHGYLLNMVELQRKHYISPAESRPVAGLYQDLSDNQKALTPVFWNALLLHTRPSIFGEASYMGKQLWRIARDFDDQFGRAKAKGLNIPDSVINDPSAPLPLFNPPGFSLKVFMDEALGILSSLCESVLDRRGVGNDSAVPLFLSDHLLLGLDERELNFLPIWADGLDDGSGGVFQEVIPPAEMGPSEPGPAYHTGYTVGTDASTTGMTGCGSTAPSDLGIGNLELCTNASSARSMDAEQSVTTGPARGRVVAARSVQSEAYSTADNEYADAMFAVPVEHQNVGQALARYVEDPSEADTILSRSEYQDDMAWSTVESIDEREVLGEATGAGLSSAGGNRGQCTTTSTARGSSSALDGFGLEDGEDMSLDDFDDDTSTLDGSDYDLI